MRFIVIPNFDEATDKSARSDNTKRVIADYKLAYQLSRKPYRGGHKYSGHAILQRLRKHATVDKGKLNIGSANRSFGVGDLAQAGKSRRSGDKASAKFWLSQAKGYQQKSKKAGFKLP